MQAPLLDTYLRRLGVGPYAYESFESGREREPRPSPRVERDSETERERPRRETGEREAAVRSGSVVTAPR